MAGSRFALLTLYPPVVLLNKYRRGRLPCNGVQ
jgi:hypothetical protein